MNETDSYLSYMYSVCYLADFLEIEFFTGYLGKYRIGFN